MQHNKTAQLMALGALDSPPRTGLSGIAGLEAEMRDRMAEKDRVIAQLRAQVADLEALLRHAETHE